MKVLHNIVVSLLAFWAVFTLFGIDIYSYNIAEHDDKLVHAAQNMNYVFDGLAILTLLFLLKKKYAWVQYVEMLVWLVFFIIVPFLVRDIPSVHAMYAENQHIEREI